MANRVAVILAAGHGKRMKSSLIKVLHPVAGMPMIGHTVKLVQNIGVDRCIVIVGHQGERVKEYLGDRVEYVEQREQLGTGHAVLQAADAIDPNDRLLVLCGDTPLLTEAEIKPLFDKMEEGEYAAVLLSATLDDPTGYGRIIRDDNGYFVRIVEEADATEAEKACSEVNAGIYCFQAGLLMESLANLKPDNAQGEYYLVDAVTDLAEQGKGVAIVRTEHPEHVQGVNNRSQLAMAERTLQERIREQWLQAGVTMIAPETVWIDADVTIGQDTVLYPDVVLRAGTVVGEWCEIGPSSEIIGSTLGNRVVVKRSVVEESRLEDEVQVGPFAHLRPGNHLKEGVRIGNYAELKNATVETGSKIPHHCYLGDVTVGKQVNIGAGVVTVNYDGKVKNRTTISDHAFVGCNVNLIAPVTIEQEGYVAAGSTINRDVPSGDLAIARARQENKTGWAKRFLSRKK